MRKLLWLILLNSTAMPFTRCGTIYKCFYCSKTFHKASDLKAHTTNHDDANQRFRIVNRYDGRTSIKVDITELRCRQCDKEFATLNTLLSHLKQIHNENFGMEALKHIDSYKLSDSGLKCLVCDETFEYFNPLLLHTLRFHKMRPLICELCGLSFSTKRSMARHFQSAHETNRRTYKCTHCGKNFSAPHRLDDHEKRIHSIRARKCHICGEVLGSTFIKANHLATVHNFRIAEFKCENCPKVFRLQNHLVTHNKRVHLKEKTKVCTVCGDKFFENRLLALHMVRHSDEKPFQCEVCHKMFSRKKGLEIHVRIHTGDKRCVCQECGEAFVQTASLKLHLRVHHGIEKNPQANK